jgi:hypothetical protein
MQISDNGYLCRWCLFFNRLDSNAVIYIIIILGKVSNTDKKSGSYVFFFILMLEQDPEQTQTLKKLVILSPKICVRFGRMCRSCGCGRYVPEDEILAAPPLAPTGNNQFNPLNLEFYLFFNLFLSIRGRSILYLGLR